MASHMQLTLQKGVSDSRKCQFPKHHPLLARRTFQSTVVRPGLQLLPKGKPKASVSLMLRTEWKERELCGGDGKGRESVGSGEVGTGKETMPTEHGRVCVW